MKEYNIKQSLKGYQPTKAAAKNKYRRADLSGYGGKYTSIRNLNYDGSAKNGDPFKPGFEDIPSYMKGLISLHEIGGHAYLRQFQPALSLIDHNRAVEQFETNCRQFYKIGTYDEKAARKANRHSIIKVSVGDPEYLGGSADPH